MAANKWTHKIALVSKESINVLVVFFFYLLLLIQELQPISSDLIETHILDASTQSLTLNWKLVSLFSPHKIVCLQHDTNEECYLIRNSCCEGQLLIECILLFISCSSVVVKKKERRKIVVKRQTQLKCRIQIVKHRQHKKHRHHLTNPLNKWAYHFPKPIRGQMVIRCKHSYYLIVSVLEIFHWN